MKKEQGFILISTLLLILCLSTLLISISRQTLTQKRMFYLEEQKIQAYYLARAGLAYGKYLAQDKDWATDNKSVSQKMLKKWLLTPFEEGGSKGLSDDLTNGRYKVVKITGQTPLYSIGFIGSSPLTARYKLIIKEENGKWHIL